MVAPASRHEPDGGGGVAQRQHLGVGGGVAGELALVVAAGDDPAVDDDDGPDGHVAVLERGAGLLEGEAHQLVVGHHGPGPYSPLPPPVARPHEPRSSPTTGTRATGLPTSHGGGARGPLPRVTVR